MRRAAQHQRVARAAAGRVRATRWPPSCRRRRLAPLPRPRRDRAARGASPSSTASAPSQVFAANGSNEVLQTLLLAYGGAGPHGRRVRADLRAARPHRPHHRHRRRRGRARRADFALDLDEVAACSPSTDPTIAFLCSPNNPTGHGRAAGRPCASVLDLRARPRRRRRGLRRSSRRGRALELVDDDRAARRHPHVLEDVVDGRAPASATSSARRGWSPSSRRWCCRTTSTRAEADRRARSRCDFVDEMERAGRVARRGAGPARRRAGRAAASTCGRRAPTSSCSGPPTATAHDGVAAAARPRRARARLLVVAPPRRLPARHRRHARRERRVPRRARRGPAHDDARPRAPRERATTKETTIDVALDARRHRRRRRSSTGIPFFDHMLDQLGSHGGFDLDGRRPRATSRSTATTRSRTSASRSARRSREALGDKAGVRRFASGLVPARRGARRGRARPLGPPVPRLRRRRSRRGAAARRPAVRPAAGRALLAGVRHRGRHHAARRASARARTPTTSSRRRSRASPAACATRCGSRATACRRPRARCDGDRPLIAVLDYGIGNLRSAQKALAARRRRRAAHRRPRR